MVATTDQSLWQEIFSRLLKVIFKVLSNLSRRLWRFVKYRLFKVKDTRIIYGQIGARQIFDYQINRSSHTTIKGKTGFGKSALAVNLAIQNLNLGTRTLFIDPHGDPESNNGEKGASVEIYERVKDTKNLIFLTVNQKHKVIGYNPFFLIANFHQLDELKDDLMNTIFYNSKGSIDTGFEVANRAEFILDTVVYFHNAYFDWLLSKNQDPLQIKQIMQTHQITINDLARLEDNPSLIDLLIAILGFQDSKYYRPDLVAKWEKLKAKNTFDEGLKGATGRLNKIVSTAKSKLFFESHGYNLLDELKQNKSVLCDISKLDPFTIAIITKLILVNVYKLHVSGILKGQTEMYIDEASNVELPNLPTIITQGRKKQLALTLIYQFTKQFKNPDIINAIHNTIVTKINFRNAEADFNAPIDKIANLKKREFLIENSRGVFEKVKTLDMPDCQRQVEFVERGEDREDLRSRIMVKQTDIYSYFINVD